MGGPARAPALPVWCAASPHQPTDWWAGTDLRSAGIPARMGGVVFYVVTVKTVIPYCMKCRSKENATLTPIRSITEKLTASVKEKSLSL